MLLYHRVNQSTNLQSKEYLNIGGKQLHQYQQNEQPPLTITY